MKLEDILKEAGLLDKIAFGDENDDRFIAKLQGAKPGSEGDNPFEQRLYISIMNWLESINDNDLYKYKDKIDTLVKQYPVVFKPTTPIGTTLYRGLGDLNKKLIKELRTSSITDWAKMKEDFWFYKKPINYKPRRHIQSWTDNIITAKDFGGDAVLITKQTKEFYFNKKVLAAIFSQNENEVIHFSNKYSSPVYIAIDEILFQADIQDYLYHVEKNKNLTFKSIGTQIKGKKK